MRVRRQVDDDRLVEAELDRLAGTGAGIADTDDRCGRRFSGRDARALEHDARQAGKRQADAQSARDRSP
jgi:hypothetical protein